MGLLWAIISWIIIGGLAGLLARAIKPGKDGMSMGYTIILGVVGAVVGGFIGGLLGGKGIEGVMNDPWSLTTILLAVIGAIIVLFIAGFVGNKPRR